jgi:hypothetical protein
MNEKQLLMYRHSVRMVVCAMSDLFGVKMSLGTVTPLVSFFQVMLSRSTAAAQALLGENFGGILNSDRYNAYNWLDVAQRQLCWAHIKREFTKISERQGVSRQLGRDLLAQQKKLFRLWQRVRDGTLSRSEFQSLVSPIRERVRSLLEQGANYQIGSREKTPLAKTVRTCRQLLKVETALWLFVTVEGLEPTNNAADSRNSSGCAVAAD